MASGNRRGRDWVLGGRQLFGVFVLLVVLFGMVFTLGYLLGRHQYDEQLEAAASLLPGKSDSGRDRINEKPLKAGGRTAEKPEKPGTPASDWDFYHVAEPAKPAEPLTETPKSLVPGRTVVPAAGKSVPRIDSSRSNLKSVNPPAIPRGAVVLQGAARGRQADGGSVAQAVHQEKCRALGVPACR